MIHGLSWLSDQPSPAFTLVTSSGQECSDSALHQWFVGVPGCEGSVCSVQEVPGLSA